MLGWFQLTPLLAILDKKSVMNEHIEKQRYVILPEELANIVVCETEEFICLWYHYFLNGTISVCPRTFQTTSNKDIGTNNSIIPQAMKVHLIDANLKYNSELYQVILSHWVIGSLSQDSKWLKWTQNDPKWCNMM